MTAIKDLRIFVVDVDPIYRELYRQYLLNMGVNKIELFSSGNDCIEGLEKIPDIIFIDHYLASTDCLENLKKIKRINPDIYIVFISDTSNMDVAVNALKYGAFDYIIKGEREEEMMRSVVKRILHVMEVLSIKVFHKQGSHAQ